ncbi:MAG: FAD-dependent oxidoreductase [Candidatus Omnitrophica bacterium]|nr:FAD-dependent oxidoreductase [Candidatus Omnitrophota bacterium]
MAKKKIIILGAGLAGLSTAWHLQRKGYDCQIFEKESETGGLCRSKKINGFTFDYDGHLLHFKHNYTLQLIKDLLGENIIRHRRSAWIYSFGRFSHYPFQANLYGLPKSIVKDCLLEFIKTNRNGCKIKESTSFRYWIDKTFGKGIANHFMIPYNTKFWTVPLADLTCEWIDGFIPIPTLSQILEGTIKESRQNLGYNASFWYPERGINEVSRVFTKEIKNIYPRCCVNEINLNKKEIRLNGKQKEKFDFLISTIPLPEMLYLLRKLPRNIAISFKNLRWNSIFNLNLGIEKKLNHCRHWVYFPEKDFCFFRVGFPSNFSSLLAPADKSSIYVEISYSGGKPIDKNNIVLRIKEDLKKAGIITPDDQVCLEDTNDIKYAYPIYDHNYRQSREKILKFLIQNNIIPCGRYGSWRYMSMEDVILDGKNIAKGMLNKL